MRDAGRQILSYLPEGLRALIQQLVSDVEWLKRKVAERREDPPPAPVIFHWPGFVEDFVDDRNGPGAFDQPGLIYRIEYLWDTAPASSATVTWHYGGSTIATHTVGVAGSQHAMTTSYTGGGIAGKVTAVDSTAQGLTALVFLQ